MRIPVPPLHRAYKWRRECIRWILLAPLYFERAAPARLPQFPEVSQLHISDPTVLALQEQRKWGMSVKRGHVLFMGMYWHTWHSLHTVVMMRQW